MQVDAHYYALLAMARLVGIEKEVAHKIAYASQFVDDVKINQMTLSDSNHHRFLERLSDTPEIINAATCHNYLKMDTFNYGAMINNTTAFHFVPGCDGDSFVKKMRCKKESPIIMDILAEAIKDNDPIKLGISLHAYADTFSHQGFSGIPSKVNDVEEIDTINKINKKKNIKKLLFQIIDDIKHSQKDWFMPAYGHGQVFQYSDIPYLKWKYCYDRTNDFTKEYEEVIVHNSDRFKDAFENIKHRLEEFLANHPQVGDNQGEENDYDDFYTLLTARKIKEERIDDWRTFLLEQELLSETDEDILYYDESIWLQDAFSGYNEGEFCNRIVEDVQLDDQFLEADWYRYYQGVQWYKKLFFRSAVDYDLMIPNEYL